MDPTNPCPGYGSCHVPNGPTLYPVDHDTVVYGAGQLPFTGMEVAFLVGLAVVLLAAGLLLRFSSRGDA